MFIDTFQFVFRNKLPTWTSIWHVSAKRQSPWQRSVQMCLHTCCKGQNSSLAKALNFRVRMDSKPKLSVVGLFVIREHARDFQKYIFIILILKTVFAKSLSHMLESSNKLNSVSQWLAKCHSISFDSTLCLMPLNRSVRISASTFGGFFLILTLKKSLSLYDHVKCFSKNILHSKQGGGC